MGPPRQVKDGWSAKLSSAAWPSRPGVSARNRPAPLSGRKVSCPRPSDAKFVPDRFVPIGVGRTQRNWPGARRSHDRPKRSSTFTEEESDGG
jgi:hypothetical protein